MATETTIRAEAVSTAVPQPAKITSTAARLKADSVPIPELSLFFVVCLADMLSTIYWYQHGIASESNPLLAYWLKRSTADFCIAKMWSFVPLAIVCIVFRKTYHKFITKALRIAIAAYLGIYFVSIAGQYLMHR